MNRNTQGCKDKKAEVWNVPLDIAGHWDISSLQLYKTG